MRTSYNMSVISDMISKPDVSAMASEISKMERAIILPPARNPTRIVPETKCHALELFITKVNEDIKNYKSNTHKSNPSNNNQKITK